MIKRTHKILLTLSALIILPIIGIAMSTIALPPSQKLSDLLQDVTALNKALEKDPDLLSGTRLSNLKLPGLVLEGATLENLHWTNIKIDDAQWDTVTIKNSHWYGVTIDGSDLKNVSFDDMYMTIDENTTNGNTQFSKGVYQNVEFKDSKLINVDMYELVDSQIKFTASTVINDRSVITHHMGIGGISDLQAHIVIEDSTIDVGLLAHIKYPTEIYIENSKVVGGISGALKRIEIRNSYVLGNAGKSVDYAYVENSEIDVGFIKSKFVHLKNNQYLHTGSPNAGSIGIVEIDTLIIDECRNPIVIAIGRTVQNFYIRNCTLSEPSIDESHIGKLDICNSTIDSTPKPSIRAADSPWRFRDVAWNDAKIRELNLYNVQFQGDLPSKVKDLQIGTLGSDGQHPIPAQIQNAATHTTRLTQCPTLPDVEALKQKALSEEPVASLSDLIWATIDSGLPVPFEKIEAEGKQLQFTFNRDWLHATQALYTMAPTPTLPPIRAVTLSEYDDDIGTDNYTFQSYIDIKLKSPEHYRPVAGRDPDTLYAESDRHVESFNSRLHMLILWFEPNEHLPEYAHTPPLAINIVLPDVINNRLFGSASWSLSAYKMNRVQWPKEPFMQTV